MAEQSFRNQFLIALPALKGDYFEDSVSLLIEHNEDGAFGLMINRVLKTPIEELFPDVSGRFTCPVLEGGPVEQNRVFFLHETGPVFESTLAISDDVSLTTSVDFIESMKKGRAPEKTLAILGYSGWSGQQLEDELSENVWLLSPANGTILYNVPFEDRAHAAASTLGVDLNLISPSAGHD
ncbi:MAG: YqgE/AlgH family protein [Gammaproteobacteria bacterium]|nr:YqgE/AlgH family protein [Gammaproteobacteria bacterium]